MSGVAEAEMNAPHMSCRARLSLWYVLRSHRDESECVARTRPMVGDFVAALQTVVRTPFAFRASR